MYYKNRIYKTHYQRWKQTTGTVIVCVRRKQDVGIFHSTLVAMFTGGAVNTCILARDWLIRQLEKKAASDWMHYVLA